MIHTGDEVVDAWQRMHEAAQALDTLRGDAIASNWLARHVREMIRAEQTEDLSKVRALTRALEKNLQQNRDPTPIRAAR